MAKKTAAPKPVPTAQDHDKLHSFLRIFETIASAALTVAPAVAAPFIKNDHSQAVLAAETPIAGNIAQTLALLASQK